MSVKFDQNIHTIYPIVSGTVLFLYPCYLFKYRYEIPSSKNWFLTLGIFGCLSIKSYKDTPISVPTKFAIAQIITQWGMKVSQINTLGSKYFTKRNITKYWEIILDTFIPAQIKFGYNAQNQTRKKALLQASEMAFNFSIMYGSSKLISKVNDNNTFLLGILRTLQCLPIIAIQGNIFALIVSLIFGNRIKIEKYGYILPIKSLNLQDFWKRWSTHFGTCLRDCVYIPLGGKNNPIISMIGTGIVCGIQHMIIHYIVGGNPRIKFNAKAFSLIYTGTIIDAILGRYNKPKKWRSIMVARYALMLATFGGNIIISSQSPQTNKLLD